MSNLVIDQVYRALNTELRKILAGGIVLTGISRQKTPSVFGANQEILPCVLLRATTEVRLSALSFTELYFALFFYEQGGDGQITRAAQEAYRILSKQRPGGFPVYHESNTFNQYDDVLQANLIVSRYKYLYIKGY